MTKTLREDDFEKLKLIGGGSYGQVYKARRKDDTSQLCALKYVSKNKSRKQIKDARNEIYILERLRHPHIIQLIGSFDTHDHIVLVSEYAVKELFRALRSEWKGKYTEEKARGIACQVSSALFYLHSQKVLHRDLKPQNVLLTKDDVIKLCDFGFAKFMGEKYYARTIQGTLYYMAPELLSEDQHVHYTEKVDLWALGCLIYELCAGHPPFVSKSIRELRHLQRILPLHKNMSDQLKNLLKRMLECDKHHRAPWPHILKHPWFQGGIIVSEFDLARESPYTKPEIASEKRKEYYDKVRMIRRYKKLPAPRRTEERDANYGVARIQVGPAPIAVPEEVTTKDTKPTEAAIEDTDEVKSIYDNVDGEEFIQLLNELGLEQDEGDVTDGEANEESEDTVIVFVYEEEEHVDVDHHQQV